MRDASCHEQPKLDWFSGIATMAVQCRNVCRRGLARSECLEYATEGDGVGSGAGSTSANAASSTRGRATRVPVLSQYSAS